MAFKFRTSHETVVLLAALAGGLPALAISVALVLSNGHSTRLDWTLILCAVAFWLALAFALRERVANPLRTLASLLEAIREGDFSIRARVRNPEDALGEVMEQVNQMAATLRDQRLGALEATALLRKVMEEIDVAVFAFDPSQSLRLVNRAGERLLARPTERMFGSDATSLGLAEFLVGPEDRIIQRSFPGSEGRWGVRRSQIREGGVPHALVVVTDLTRPLREEELKAWQRLVRVIGHELNNSLAPIQSIARSLESLLTTDALPDDWREDTTRGLNVIANRSESLSRFMTAYAQLAKMPPPRFAPIELGALLRRAASLETRLRVSVEVASPVTIQGDADQLEQVLINLVSNAVEASAETGGGVFVRQERTALGVEIVVRDHGPGLANTANLFVPFFTTKRGGSGIGLVLSQQIAEAHHGSVSLRNASDGPGCEARLSLPIA